MSLVVYTQYAASLSSAMSAVTRGDREAAMRDLGRAMQCANKSKDARYRRAVFRAMSFTRRIGTV